MKKNDNKGFMLAETLIVSTFILGTLVFLFVQFRNINHGYQTSFTYNTVDALYAAENMKNFYLQDNFTEMADIFRSDSMDYIDLTSCPAPYVRETEYCKKLMETLEINKIIFIDENTSYVQEVFDSMPEISSKMKNFIEYIDYDNQLLTYRLVVEMKDETFASIKIESDGAGTMYTLQNLIQSGSFENTGWSSVAASFSTEQAKYGTYSYKMQGNTSTPEVVAYTTHTIPLDPTHIYYARVEAYQNTKAGTVVQMYWPEAEPWLLIEDMKDANQWNLYSYRNNRATFTAMNAALRIDYDNAYTTEPIYYDGAMLIDLTAVFGSGNEPSKEWCDRMIPFFEGSYSIFK